MPKQGASLSAPDGPPSPGPAGVAGGAQRRGFPRESPVELKEEVFHENRRSNSKKRFSRDHRQLTGEIQKKRFCRTSCSCQTKREVRDFTGPTGITGKNRDGITAGLHTTSGKCRTRLKRRGFDTSCSCQAKFKGKRLCTGLTAVESKRRGCYRTT